MAGWTKVGSASNGSAGTTLVLGSIPAGSFIRVCTYGGSPAGTISDASGDTGASSYTLGKSQANSFDGGTAQEFWLYPTVNTASRTLTAGTSVHMAASWWTPPTGTTAVSVTSSNGAASPDGNSTSLSSGNVTAALGDLVAGFTDNSNSVSATWTAGGTSAGGSWATDVQTSEGAHVVYAQYVVATSAGTFTSQPVYGSADAFASVAIVYHAATGGGSAPVNTVAPAVTGIPAATKTLTTTNGTWTGDTSSGFAYQWKDGSGNIASATASTYVVGAGEKTRSIHCTVTATGTGGSTAQDSNTVGPIGTSTGNLAGRMEFQGLIVDDAAVSGATPNYRILKRRRS